MDDLEIQQCEKWWKSLPDFKLVSCKMFIYKIHKLSFDSDKEIINLKEKYELEKKNIFSENDLENQKTIIENKKQLEQTINMVKEQYIQKLKEKNNTIKEKNNIIREKEISIKEKDLILQERNNYIRILGEKNTLENKNLENMEKRQIRKIEDAGIKTYSEIQELKKIIESLQRKNKSNYKLGAEGENFIDLIFMKYFDNSYELIDVSKKYGNGDRMIKKDKFSMIIEVKNDTQISLSSNFKKYRNDLIVNLKKAKNEENTNCAIFVNTEKNTHVNNNEVMNHEFLNTEVGKFFILYITSLEENETIFSSSVRLCERMSEIINKCDKNTNKLEEIVKKHFPKIQEIMSNLVNHNKLIDEFKKVNCNNIKIVNELLSDLMNVLSLQETRTISDLNRIKKSDDEVFDIVKKAYTKLIKERRKISSKNLEEETGLSYSIISKRLGGIKQLKDVMMNDKKDDLMKYFKN